MGVEDFSNICNDEFSDVSRLVFESSSFSPNRFVLILLLVVSSLPHAPAFSSVTLSFTSFVTPSFPPPTAASAAVAAAVVVVVPASAPPPPSAAPSCLATSPLSGKNARKGFL